MISDIGKEGPGRRGVPAGVFGAEDITATEDHRRYILRTSVGCPVLPFPWL